MFQKYGFPPIFLILILLSISLTTFFLYLDKVEKDNFDKAYDQGKVKLTTTQIKMGGSSLAEKSTVPYNIPNGYDPLEFHPRLYVLSGCNNIRKLPSKASGVYASTDSVSDITVEVPLKQDGGVKICGPTGQYQIMLWAFK